MFASFLMAIRGSVLHPRASHGRLVQLGERRARIDEHTNYVVVRDQGQWKISLNGVHYGPYPTQRDAVRAAVDAAHEAGRKGLNGQVLLRDQVSIEWTYGRDPYPPNSSDFLGPYANAETPAKA